MAQNDQDLNAEEGNSSFDVRHKVTGNWVLELPFGPNRAFLSKGGFWSKALDGFSLSGDFTFATGTYYTPHYVSTVAETATGTQQFAAARSGIFAADSRRGDDSGLVQSGCIYGSGERISERLRADRSKDRGSWLWMLRCRERWRWARRDRLRRG